MERIQKYGEEKQITEEIEALALTISYAMLAQKKYETHTTVNSTVKFQLNCLCLLNIKLLNSKH